MSVALPLMDRTAAEVSTDNAWLSRVVLFTPLIMATVLSKFSPAGVGMPALSLVLPVTFIVALIGLWRGQMVLVSQRVVLLLVMLSALGLIQVWRGEAFSLPSMLMMTVLSCAYVPMLRQGSIDSSAAVNFFCNLSAAIALLGILQFALQFLVGKDLVFPIETWVPAGLRSQGYNNVVPLFWGSQLYKANGVVMVEPSVFSQLCALGLIAELTTRDRWWRLAVYAGAMVVAYSGTGLMILAVSLPLLVLVHRRWDLVLKGLLLLLILVLLAEPLNLQVILNRVNEFGSSGSSGYERFVGWQNLFADRLWNDPWRALFGYGAGSYFDAAQGYRAGEMAHAKIMFEFGVIGALLYFGFIFYCVFSSQAPLMLRVAVIVAYFMNGAYSPTVTGIVVSMLLWPAASPRCGTTLDTGAPERWPVDREVRRAA